MTGQARLHGSGSMHWHHKEFRFQISVLEELGKALIRSRNQVGFQCSLVPNSRQCWGHQCPRCRNYFRNGQHPAIYPLTCPYCGLRTNAYRFLTPAQKAYVTHYLDTLLNALDEEMQPGTEREIVIDMDAVADQKPDQPKPAFYYTSASQQTRYKCEHCGEFNDIRGLYGYCASCGRRNNVQSLKGSFGKLRERLISGQSSPIDTIKSAVSEFDACCRDLTVQLTTSSNEGKSSIRS